VPRLPAPVTSARVRLPLLCFVPRVGHQALAAARLGVLYLHALQGC